MATEDADYPFVNLRDLDKPPENWQLVRRRGAELKKNLRLSELRALVEYHTFGFRCQKIFGRKQGYIDLLHKILYYTQTGLGKEEAFTQGGIICAGPVGPGTLPQDLRNARGLPAWYLTEQAALEKIQPHQSLCPAPVDGRHRPGAKLICYDIVPGTTVYANSSATCDERPDVTQQTILAPDLVIPPTPPAVRGFTDPGAIYQSPDPSQVILIPDDSDDHEDTVVAAGTATTTAQMSDANGRVWATAAENVRKAVLASTYSGLDVVPDALLQPRPFLLATKTKELLRTLTQRNIATSHISVKFTGNTNYSVAENGAQLRYYGRGPVWNDNSCFWDSIIVVCLFLNAGFTYLDRGMSADTWENSLTTIQKAFLDVLRMDWDFFDDRTSIAQRNMFLELFYREWRDEGLTPKPKPRGEMDSPAARWNDVSGPFNQFSFRAHQRIQPCTCQSRGPRNNAPAKMGFITPPYQRTDRQGITVTSLLRRWSHFVLPHCQSGSKETKTIIHGNLPLRMVVQPTAGAKLLDHTSQNISFTYTRTEPGSSKEIQDRVTYRWLGGVYSSGSHFRVYWNDSASDAKIVNSLRIYDGMEAAGAIIGNVLPAVQFEPIPDYWMKHCPPLLFYEQVVDPEPLALEAAQSVITDLLAKQFGRPVFPHTFLDAAAKHVLSSVRTDALLPRQLPNAVLRVKGPSTGYHNRQNRLRPSLFSPPATPEIRRGKRHRSRAESEDTPQSSPSNSQKRKRRNEWRPGMLTPPPHGAQNNPVYVVSTSSENLSNSRKRKTSGKR